MHPEAQAWRDRLECSVRKIDDIFENALREAQAVLSPEGLEAWLAGADRICGLGRGTELVLIFLEEMPEVVRCSDEAILLETAELAAHLSEQALGKAINPFLSTLPAVARRLDSAASLRGWLQLVERMSLEAREKTEPLLRQARSLFGQISLAGVERWIDYGLRVYRDQPHRAGQAAQRHAVHRSRTPAAPVPARAVESKHRLPPLVGGVRYAARAAPPSRPPRHPYDRPQALVAALQFFR